VCAMFVVLLVVGDVVVGGGDGGGCRLGKVNAVVSLPRCFLEVCS